MGPYGNAFCIALYCIVHTTWFKARHIHFQAPALAPANSSHAQTSTALMTSTPSSSHTQNDVKTSSSVWVGLPRALTYV